MATGSPDAQGVWQYGEDDTLYPFSDFMNLGQQSVSEQLAAIRDLIAGPWVPVVPASGWEANSHLPVVRRLGDVTEILPGRLQRSTTSLACAAGALTPLATLPLGTGPLNLEQVGGATVRYNSAVPVAAELRVDTHGTVSVLPAVAGTVAAGGGNSYVTLPYLRFRNPS